MRKIILFTAFLSLSYLPVFSQQNSQLKLSHPNSGISLYGYRNPSTLIKPFDFTTVLKDSVYHKKIYIPKIPDTHLLLGQFPVAKPDSISRSNINIDRMPCLKPTGVFL